MASSRDFFDPSIQQAQFVGDRVAKLSERDLLLHGAKLVAEWEIKLDPEAQLKALERFVKEESLGKIFGDNQVIDAIDAERVSTVKFFELKDGSGVQIAKIQGGTNSMLALLSKADMDDLILTPQYREPKAKAVEGPKTAKLLIGGGEITVKLEEAKAEAPRAPKILPPLHRVAGAMAVPMHNPVAMKEFLARAWTQDSMALPSGDAKDMPLACIVATSPEAHPSDAAWPSGITVTDKKTGEAISGPAKAMAMFDAAINGREGPVVSRDDLVSQLKARKIGM